MNNYFLILFSIVLFTVYLWLGKNSAKNISGNSDFFLMGKKLTFGPLCFTLLATQLGGGTLIGAAEHSFEKGWETLLYPLGTFLGFLFLSFGFGAKLRKMDIETIPEIFEKIFLSRFLRQQASVISIISFFLILVSQGIAAKKFFITIGLINPIYFVVFWIVFVIYTVAGGLKAVVKTDIIQSIIILLGLVLAVLNLDLNQLNFQHISYSDFTLNNFSVYYLLMPLGFMLIEQDMAQRCFAVKNPKIIAPAAITAGILLFAGSTIAVLFGIIAKDMTTTLDTGSSILVSTVQQLTHPMVASFFMIAVAMAIASTADSLICSTASLLSCDFVSYFKITNKNKLAVSRILTFVIGSSSLILTFYFDSVLKILLLSYELSVSALFIPVIMAVVSDQHSKHAALFSFYAGILSFILLNLIKNFYFFPWEITETMSILITISLSLSAYFIGYITIRQKK